MSEFLESLQYIDWELVWDATLDTLYMSFVTMIFTILLGVPLGILLFLLSPGQNLQNKYIYNVLSTIVNILRSFPFVILLVVMIPVTRLIIGTTIGAVGVIPPLIASAVPFFARMIENVLKGVDFGVIEACRSMGATTFQMVRLALLPEIIPGIVGAISITTISIIGLTAMAGVVGGGGLGDVAIQYGYNRYEPAMLWITVPIIILIVQVIEFIGTKLQTKLDHRKQNSSSDSSKSFNKSK